MNVKLAFLLQPSPWERSHAIVTVAWGSVSPSEAAEDSHCQNFGTQARTAANLAWLSCHERPNAIARKFAFGFLEEPLHLWHQTFERLADLLAIAANLDLDRRVTRPEVKCALKIVWQIGERRFLVDAKMFHQRSLQFFVIDLHPFRPSSPRRDHAFRDRFLRLRNHQFRIDHQLRAQPMACWTSAVVAVKRKMLRSELAQCEAAVWTSIVGRIPIRFPLRLLLPEHHNTVLAPFQRGVDGIRQPHP